MLFSFWLFNIINIVKQGLINMSGFTAGIQGQQAGPSEILMLESHGALVFLVGWSVWSHVRI